MKLVGATNWFIRVPFMLEGLIQGVIGAVLAFALTYFVRDTIASFVGNETVLGTNAAVRDPARGVLHGPVILAARGGGRRSRLGLRRPPLPLGLDPSRSEVGGRRSGRLRSGGGGPGPRRPVAPVSGFRRSLAR